MHKLPVSFALLTFCGYWRPLKWSNGSLKYRLYNVYSVFMVSVLYFFTFCICVDSVITEDLKTMTDKFSLCISVVGVCVKVANLFLQRREIINVMDILLRENCLPRDEQEKIIQRRHDIHARKLTIYCEILNESAVFFGTVAQYNQLIKSRTLPFSDWMPYDLSSQESYLVSLFYQTLSLMICANTSVANETLISGLMIQAGAQFEIFCHRARNFAASITEGENDMFQRRLKINYERTLEDLVKYHLEIYKFAHRVNVVFQYMIFLQFSISSTVLCLSIYKMSTIDPLSVNFIWSAFYLCCMLMQVYLYCWFGNEVTLKSRKVSDAIYEMDWTTLPANVIKDLLLIMIRSKRPVKMTSGHVVNLSVESFMSIMKITYSSYNLLTNSASK